jgi:hypothetical protein
MANTKQPSFAAGEIAPALYARTDTAKYATGLRTCRNMMVMRQGGATKRPGTEFIVEVKDSTKKVRLIPFIFNVRDALVMEFGNLYVRFIQNGGQVADPITPTNPYEIVSPYLEADLPDLQYVQSGDVVTIVHPNYPPYELKRFSDTNWTLTAITFGPALSPPTGVTATLGDPAVALDTDYVVTAVTASDEESLASAVATSGHPPSTTLPVAVQFNTVTGANSYRIYRNVNGVFAYVGTLIPEVGPTQLYVDLDVVPDLFQQPPIPSTLFQSANNYPSVVGYYQQRLIFANSNNNPDTFWCSRTGMFHNFNTSVIVQDDDAITARPVSDEVDAIRHVLNTGRLVIGTEGVDWIVDGDGNGVLTPTAVNMRAASYDGMSRLRPIKVGARMLFVQALGAAVRELQANVQFGYYSLVGGDITIYSSHLVDGFGIVDWAFQQEPPKIVWAVRSDGLLLAVTYIPEQEVLAWHRHDSRGFIENVCVVPEGRSHWLYWVCRRLINGAYHRYIERMTTSTVLPVFATPEEGATGPIVTPPPPPPPPPPSTSPLSPPTTASTTAILSTSATANWIAGNALAATSVEYRKNDGFSAWTVLSDAPPGQQSEIITGLLPATAYEWRARHVLGTVFSDYLGPNTETRFTTLTVVPTRDAPVSAPVVTTQTANAGSTDLTITWPASSETTVITDIPVSRLQIAGPLALTPTDGEFADVGTGTFLVTTAVTRVTVTGTYWLRVRYEFPDGTISAWSSVSSWAVTVT